MVGDGVPLLLHVGGVGEQSQNPLLSVSRKTVHICHGRFGARQRDFKVTGVHNDPAGGAHGKAHAIHSGVADANGIDFKGADAKKLAGMKRIQGGGDHARLLFQFAAHNSQGKGGTIHWKIHFPQKIGQGANVVFVGVGEDHRQHAGGVLFDVIHGGNDDVDSQHVILWKHQASVDDDGIITVLNDHHVQANFTQSPQWYDSQGFHLIG